MERVSTARPVPGLPASVMSESLPYVADTDEVADETLSCVGGMSMQGELVEADARVARACSGGRVMRNSQARAGPRIASGLLAASLYLLHPCSRRDIHVARPLPRRLRSPFWAGSARA